MLEKGRDRVVMRLTGSGRRSRSVAERMLRRKDTISWMVVRNPLSRIVSAYRYIYDWSFFVKFGDFRNKFECMKGKEWYYEVKTLSKDFFQMEDIKVLNSFPLIKHYL